MFIYLLILFTVVPLIELTLLIKVGTIIGLANTVLLVLGTGIWGAYLAKKQGLSTLTDIQTQMQQGILPSDKILDGIMILCAGLLLITPGLLTDTVGFSLLIPYTRNLIKKTIQSKIKMQPQGFQQNNQSEHSSKEEKIITVESYTVEDK